MSGKFTDKILDLSQRIPEMTSEEIAQEVGCSGSLVRRTWRLYVPKGKRRPAGPRPKNTELPINKDTIITFAVHKDTALALATEADKRGLTWTDLGRKILTTVIADNLYTAILEE